MKKLVVARRASQIFFLTLFVYILWSTTYPLTGLLPADTFFRTDPLLAIMTSISSRIILPGIFLAIAMVVLTLIVGRFFCGWVCPLGTTIDLTGALAARIAPKKQLSDGANKMLRMPKFIFFAIAGIAALFGTQIAWVLDPIALMGRFISLNFIPAVTSLMNSGFIFLIRDLKFEGAVRDLYRALKPSLLGVKAGYFSHAWITLLYFAAVLAATFIVSRLWCRAACPLGAFYALGARFAPLRRVVDRCKKCARCSTECRTGAIRRDFSYAQGECVMCMDCIYVCPVQGIRFGFRGPAAPPVKDPGAADGGETKGISRRQFLIFLASSLALLGFKRGERQAGEDSVIRPPAALAEDEFVDRCVRCGNCMKVCITNGLQPVMLETGYDGIWTPRLVPEVGYCEYRCTLCGHTCPTGAIRPLTLEEKMVTRLGVAEIDRSLCLPWAKGKECIVCQEHCPVAEKAIALDREGPLGVQKPRIVEELCVGCGICQNKCPVRPVRAVRVSPRNADRTSERRVDHEAFS